MADLIDRAALFANCYILEADYDDGIEPRRAYAISIESVRNAPTVDAVEVVRCKECKHWYEYSCNEKYGSCHFWQANDNENTETESDDFCSYGQRKDGAE